ncbi:MAG: hypothetical protein HYV40_02775 [Candidatus Levybacteria bacterium]|nr:hypothetical protein [Candidatus Levybacteria bacterium]
MTDAEYAPLPDLPPLSEELERMVASVRQNALDVRNNYIDEVDLFRGLLDFEDIQKLITEHGGSITRLHIALSTRFLGKVDDRLPYFTNSPPFTWHSKNIINDARLTAEKRKLPAVTPSILFFKIIPSSRSPIFDILEENGVDTNALFDIALNEIGNEG